MLTPSRPPGWRRSQQNKSDPIGVSKTPRRRHCPAGLFYFPRVIVLLKATALQETVMEYTEIINFWFDEIDTSLWFKKNEAFDQQLRDRFLEVHRSATQGELYSWRRYPEGRLAEIIVLDQFSRNLFRDSARAFAHDTVALVLSQVAIEAGDDNRIEKSRRAFMYMPFMHSESLAIHEQAVKLFSQPGLERNLEFELKHKAIIDRFGRYPHRNAVLGRESTDEELAFLQQPGSSF
jgi:uncharacterized protein (DUF924 family)